MALPSTTLHEVRADGDDTNGGCFANNAVGKATNLTATFANTSAPVVASGTYNFVSGDVGHWLYVNTGTNWYPGWYQIISVSANVATINASIGAAVLVYGAINTKLGCASVASPSGGTWAIDYSRAAAAPFALTGLTTSASNGIILTALATVAMAGNGIQITGGTNFTTGVYIITSVSVGVSLTVDRTCTSAAGSAGTANLGGAFGSPAFAMGNCVSQNRVYWKYGSYLCSVDNYNVSNGTIRFPANYVVLMGYDVIRGDDTGRYPTLTCTVNIARPLCDMSWFQVLSMSCCVFDGAFKITANGSVNGRKNVVNSSHDNGGGYNYLMSRVTAKNSEVGIYQADTTTIDRCVTYGNTLRGFDSFQRTDYINCVSINDYWSFSGNGSPLNCINCISINATQYAFYTVAGCAFTNCEAIGAGLIGFLFNIGLADRCLAVNCPTGYHYQSTRQCQLIDCAGYNNTVDIDPSSRGALDSGSGYQEVRYTILTADPYTNLAGSDYSKNLVVGGGKELGISRFVPGLPSTVTNLCIGATQTKLGGVFASGRNTIAL